MSTERKELIQLCEDAVVSHKDWGNRDSFIAQKLVQSIYKGLTAGLKYKIINEEDNSIFHSTEAILAIEFIEPDIDRLNLYGKTLEISSLKDYHRDCDPEYKTEMFDSDGIDFTGNYTVGYIPTRKRLSKGADWY